MATDEAGRHCPDHTLDALTAYDPALCASPAGHYATFSRAGTLVFSSGVVGREAGTVITGKLKDARCLPRGQHAAKAAVLALLRAAQREFGSLRRVQKVVSLTGFLHADEGFKPLREVMDAASLLLQEVFPEAALPARTCVAVAGLPGGGVAEVALVLEVADQPGANVSVGAASIGGRQRH
ncbi:MAG: endoribonuclease [Rhodoferax sp.]|nr:endoribonuclease [Rhodoferax sp.]